MNKRRVGVVLVDRANYGRLKPVMQAIQVHPDLEMFTITAGTLVLDRFDRPAAIIERDGFPLSTELFMEVEGATPVAMAKSVGLGIIEFSQSFQRLNLDIVLIIGDRYEALAAVIAAAFMNICIVHLQGGEVSGSIDESTRHAISKFAHYHVPATELAKENLLRLGEAPQTILTVGCPSADLARTLDLHIDSDVLNQRGAGAQIDVNAPFLLAAFHPTTTEFGTEAQQIEQLLRALEQVAHPTVLLWPNIDAGSNAINKTIRKFRRGKQTWLRTITNLAPEDYLKVLSRAVCAVGNSSGFVRDASLFGTPVVLVGQRQAGRQLTANILPSAIDAARIENAVRHQLAHGRYAPSTLYGDGHVSERIAQALYAIPLYAQKRLQPASTAQDVVKKTSQPADASLGFKRLAKRAKRS